MTNLDAVPLADELLERVLARLGFSARPEPTCENLRALYGAWCRRVPFDNVRKLIHLRSPGSRGLPGSTPADFFEAWLAHGTGGTCWAGASALHALLISLRFDAVRGLATMLAAPNLPPNHGTVRVTLAGEQWLVDTSMLHGEPLQLNGGESSVAHPAWGVRCERQDGRWAVAWRPLHKPDGFACRVEEFGVSHEDFCDRYKQTRGWSPFNFEVTARLNRGQDVVGVSFGHKVTLWNDGSVGRTQASHTERARVLVEDLGLSEEIVSRLPLDTPTPPPPGSQTAQGFPSSANMGA